MKTRRVKWYTEPLNFGDVLTPAILEHFGIEFKYAGRLTDADTLCVGSIARMASAGMAVFGSGVIRRGEQLCPQADWRYVRGPRSRKNVIDCGGTCPEIYGDAALLLPLMCAESDKQYDVGIMPHYADYDFVLRMYANSHHVINVVNRDPLAVAREITKCRKIISSSLHGIIAAHAYQIPTAWVSLSKLHGDGIKFIDHYESVGMVGEVSTIARPVYSEPGRVNLDPVIDVFHKAANE